MITLHQVMPKLSNAELKVLMWMRLCQSERAMLKMLGAEYNYRDCAWRLPNLKPYLWSYLGQPYENLGDQLPLCPINRRPSRSQAGSFKSALQDDVHESIATSCVKLHTARTGLCSRTETADKCFSKMSIPMRSSISPTGKSC